MLIYLARYLLGRVHYLYTTCVCNLGPLDSDIRFIYQLIRNAGRQSNAGSSRSDAKTMPYA